MFNVMTYGASGTGAALDTTAVNNAIAAAQAAGGGTVYFPAGTYLCFTIQLHSNVILCLDPGATIVAADSPLPGQAVGQLGGQYHPAGEAYNSDQDFVHSHWGDALICADGATNCGIVGRGRIWGKGLASGNTGPGSQFTPEQDGVGDKSVSMKGCCNVVLRDFSLLQGGWVGILLTGCDNVTIDNLTIDTNRDGMDIDCCSNVHIANCTVNSPWDDGICLKSSYALNRLIPTKNVAITDCIVSGYYQMGTVLDGSFQKFSGGPNKNGNPPFRGRIKCGTESNGGFQRIAISNCVFEGCDGLAIETVDGGVCEDIVVTNITMRDLVSGPLFLLRGNRLRGPPGTVGPMRRILISNIVASNVSPQYTSIITGTLDAQGNTWSIEDLKIANFYLQQQGGAPLAWLNDVPQEFGPGGPMVYPYPSSALVYPDPESFGTIPAQGLFLRHIVGLEVSHLQIASVAPDGRYPFVLWDVNTSWWTGITVPAGWVNNAFVWWPNPSSGLDPQGSDYHLRASQAGLDTDW